MTAPTLHDLLDEAADRALVDVPGPDPQAALALARRDRLSRTSFRLAGLVAAAVLVLLAASTLLASPGLLHRSAPASGPSGIPERWWTPPEWTPSVLDRPIAAAALLLDTAVVAADQDGSNGSVLFERGAVVVSADGTTYRRLPTAGSAAFLSPTGRHVAWFEGSPGQAKVVVLELATGDRRTTTLPVGSHPEAALLSWQPGDAGVVVSSVLDGTQDSTGVWRVDLAGRLSTVCRCGSAVAAAVHPVDGTVLLNSLAPGVWSRIGEPEPPELRGVSPAQRAAARKLGVELARSGPGRFAFSPDGTRVAVAPGAASDDPGDDETVLVADRRGPAVTLGLDGWSGLRVLGWTPRGVLFSGTPPKGLRPGLWTVDPDGGSPVQIATGDAGGGFGPAQVVGVAADVAASGRTVPGVEPSRSHRDLAYLEYRYQVSSLRVALTEDPHRWIVLTCVVLGVLVLAVPPLHDRRRRSRGRPTG